MASIIRSDVDSMMRLRMGLVQSSHKYLSERNLLRGVADAFGQASETNSHEVAVEIAHNAAARLETIAAAFDAIVDNLTPEIERLTALQDLTRRA